LDLFDEDYFCELTDIFDNKGGCSCFSLLFFEIIFFGFCSFLLLDKFLDLVLELIKFFFVLLSLGPFLLSLSFDVLSSVLLLIKLLEI